MSEKLTREMVLAEPAGPRMDAWVAERVLGLKPCDKWQVWGEHRVAGTDWYHKDPCAHECYNSADPQRYSAMIGSAWTVVEHTGLLFDYVLREVSPSAWAIGNYWWDHKREKGGFDAMAEADAAALAICRAALLTTVEA